MHVLEPWQAETLKALYNEKQRVIAQAQQRLTPIEQALKAQIDGFAAAAGLEGTWNVAVQQDGTMTLVQPEEEADGPGEGS